MKGEMNKKYTACIQACLDCYHECMHTVMHCLREGGDHANVEHIGRLLDCAALCQLAAEFMIRNSQWSEQLSNLCAVICEHCAIECSEGPAFSDDECMKECADACRRCAAECQKLYED